MGRAGGGGIGRISESQQIRIVYICTIFETVVGHG